MKDSKFKQRVKELRIKKGFSQEELAENSGLSIRTIQRIENDETVPRGDTLRRISIALQVLPDDVIEWQKQEDKSVVIVMNLSQLLFVAFPILGIIVPLLIWIMKKDMVNNVKSVGKSILNFQITWTTLLFLYVAMFYVQVIFRIKLFPISWSSNILILGGLYGYNLILILINTVMYLRLSKVNYVPAVRFLK